jgi:cytochrome c biogenesis factor
MFFISVIHSYFLYLFSFVFISSFTTGFSYFPDVYNRFNINDSVLNTYYFFWTSFLYLPSFYFFLVFLILWNFTRQLGTVLLIFFLLYNTEFLDFIVNNFNFISSNPLLLEINLLLTNNLNKIHPFIFYLSTILLFCYVYEILILFTQNNQYSLVWFFNFKLNYSWWVGFYNIVALFLGSWWAFQEGTWGGWWNWDSSEIFGLEFFLFFLFVIHTLFKVSNFSSWVLVLIW